MTGRHTQYVALLLFTLPLALSSLAATGCGAEGGAPDATTEGSADYLGHAEPTDFQIGPPARGMGEVGKADETEATFDRHDIISEALFLDTESVSVAEMQTFLEDSPYGERSWLADERVGGRSAAAHLVAAAREFSVNPLLLLSRLQVEQALVSQSERPSQYRVDRAMGCGCYDGQECFPDYLGLDRQFQCAAETMRELYDGSVDDTRAWRRGHSHTTLDGVTVTPQTHATAAMYAYTPWVLEGRGGNWLVWNITRRFVLHLQDQGALEAPAWIGTACEHDSDCNFTGGDAHGFCYDFVDPRGERRGICSLPCEGVCPDREGEALTFCAPADVPGAGICVSTPDDANGYCADLTGTVIAEEARFVGDSGVDVDIREVCAPDAA